MYAGSTLKDLGTDLGFRESGLYREKWERADYRERTVSKALEGRTEFYQPTRMVPINMGTTNTANATNTDFVEDSEFLELPEASPFPIDALQTLADSRASAFAWKEKAGERCVQR